MKSKGDLLKEIAKEFVVYEAKLAGARCVHRLGTHKIPFIAKNGILFELIYDLRYLPGYIFERVTDGRNAAIFNAFFSLLGGRQEECR